MTLSLTSKKILPICISSIFSIALDGRAQFKIQITYPPYITIITKFKHPTIPLQISKSHLVESHRQHRVGHSLSLLE
jgi:hypothetical protein